MKKILIITCCLAFAAANACADTCISTFAGNGQPNFSGDGGPAIQAPLSSFLWGLSFDSAGNLYFVDNGNIRIRRINTAGIINTVVGSGTEGYNGDGIPATNADLDDPREIALDAAGNMYFADAESHRLRKVDLSGMISTIAGSVQGFSGDGFASTSARLSLPYGVALGPGGVIYIADTYNQRIRMIDSGGIITTIAGDGSIGFGGDGGAASAAVLNFPNSIACDGPGNLYIADTGNHRIRKIDLSGNINTVAGNGTAAYNGDGILGTAASLNYPNHVNLDAAGNVYIVDSGNNRVRKLNLSGTISTVAGTGSVVYSGDGGPATSAGLYLPSGVAVDSAGNIFIADLNHIRKVDLGGTITLFAGSSSGGGAATASLNRPNAVLFDGAGTTYILDSYHNRLRRVNALGVIDTLAGNGFPGSGGDGGSADVANLNFPSGAVRDSAGNFYIADTYNQKVRIVNSAGIINTYAGTGAEGYLGDSGLATGADLSTPSGLALDSLGNLYIACTNANTVRKVDKLTGIITKVAGTGTPGYNGDGVPGYQAHLNSPRGLAMDADDNLYIADTNNHRIRVLNTVSLVINTFAGNGLIGSSGNGGPATAANLRFPQAVAAFGDLLYIADTGNNQIRVADIDDGGIALFAGAGVAGFGGDFGLATQALFNMPQGINVDAAGDVWICDTLNHRVRKTNSCVLTATPTPDVPAAFAEIYHNLLRPDLGESMTVDYRIPETGQVLIRVLDMKGREVKRLVDGQVPRGIYRSSWDGKDQGGGVVSSGIYFVRFEMGSFIKMKKAVVIH